LACQKALLPRGRNHGSEPPSKSARLKKSVWDDAEVVINVERTKPGTPLDDYLRKEQTRALLDLLADYVQKLDKSGNARR
jgi:hypothetical protein